MDKKRIIVLPSNKEKSKSSNDANFKKKKVAAYARVSTGQFDQELSYDAQVEFYDRYIRSNPNWEFVGIYSDKGISGVGVSKRPEFQRMIRDAKEGKIDLILTKSISRFARNTMDTLRIIRELKSDNIEVIFEKENISTLDSKSEIVLTILSSLAQEESRSISENVKWSIRKRMASGDAYCDYARLYGYTRNKYGEVMINEAEAKIARKVYELYFLGYSHRQIARILSRRKIPTKFNGKMWRLSNVCSILHNEKYIGDTLFQKTYVKDFLTKEKARNKGVLPQYYVYDTHPSIITKGTYELAQYEYRRRQKLQNPTKANSNSVSGLEYGCKIICGRCGGCYSRVKKLGNIPNRIVCSNKYRGNAEKRCRNKNIREDVFYEKFIRSYNAMLMNKDDIIRYCINSLSSLPNINAILDAVDITKLDEVQKAKIQISDLYAERERIERFMNLIKKSRKLHRFSRAAFMRSVREAIIDNENIIFRWNY